jgi:integrase/recombinase XerD
LLRQCIRSEDQTVQNLVTANSFVSEKAHEQHRSGSTGRNGVVKTAKSAISASKLADLNGGFRADVVSTRWRKSSGRRSTRDEGTTLAFSKPDARKLLDLADPETLEGLRDRAILSVGLQVGLRRAEIAALTVGDLHQNRGYDSLRVIRKGGRRDALAINPQTTARLRAYSERAGHGDDMDGPMFRPLKHNGRTNQVRPAMDPDAIDRVVRKHAGTVGLARGYSAHSMRATFITTALENGAQLEDVQKAAGHRDPSTTKLYDRRGYNPEKAASFFATY